MFSYTYNNVSNSWEAKGYIPSASCAPATVNAGDNKIVINGVNDKSQETDTVWIGHAISYLDKTCYLYLPMHVVS